MADLQPLIPPRIKPILDALSSSQNASAPPIPSLGSMGSQMPALSPIVAPSVADNSRMAANSSDNLLNRKSADEADLYRRNNPIKPTTTLGKIGHVAANIGNVLGDIFEPAITANIPGSGLNNQIQKSRDASDINAVSELQTAETGRNLTQAQADYNKARPDIEENKIQQRQQAVRDRVSQAAAGKGQKVTWDEDGNPAYADDPDLIAHAAVQSQIDLRNAQTAFDAAKSDPTSPLFQQRSQALEIAKANARAAGIRAEAYKNNYLMHAQGVGPDGKTPLNGATMLADNPVGTSLQGQVSKVLGQQGQFSDVNQGIQHTTAALTALSQEGGSLNDPAVVAALQDPTHSATEWAQGKVNSTLTPNERDAVITIKAMRERILAMRKASGGNASEGQVSRMLAMLPGPNTPDLDTATRQLKEVQSQADVLGKSVPKLHTSSSHSANSGASSTAMIRAYDDKGVLHEAPAGTPLPKGWKAQ